MRVLHVSLTDGDGGAGLAIRRLHEGLRRVGVESRVLVGRKVGVVPDAAQWPHWPRVRRRLHDLGKELGLNDVLLPYGFGTRWSEPFRWADVVHFHNLHGGYFNFLSMPIVTRGRPSVWTLHDIWGFTGHCAYSFDCSRWRHGCGECPYLGAYPETFKDATRLEWKLKAWSFSRSKLQIICPTDAMEAQVANSLLCGLSRHRINNGIDVEMFSPGNRALLRDRLAIPRDAFVVLVGAYDLRYAHKGLDLAIQSLNQMPSHGPAPIHVLLLGHGGSEIAARIVAPCTSAGFVADDAEKADIYRAADVLLYPSRADSFGLVALESIASGTPVVASRLPGLDEVVRPGSSGLLCEIGDVAGFTRALVELRENSARLGELSRTARLHAISNYSQHAHIDQHCALYDRVRRP
jgi:glycosyltransferase involved in cell wall biosynthesis